MPPPRVSLSLSIISAQIPLSTNCADFFAPVDLAIKLALTMFAGKMRVSNYLSYGLYVNGKRKTRAMYCAARTL